MKVVKEDNKNQDGRESVDTTSLGGACTSVALTMPVRVGTRVMCIFAIP